MSFIVIILLIIVSFVLSLATVWLKDFLIKKDLTSEFNDYQKPISSHTEMSDDSFETEANLKNTIYELKEIIENSKHLLESSEKKNITKVLNRISQGLFRFLNGELEVYKKNDVELLFEEIQELFISINHKLIIPVENDLFNQETMISRDFVDTDDERLEGKVFRTTVLGVKEIIGDVVVKKAEVILFKKEKN